ncbi:MAG TPA: hypothetical protein VH108_11770 [Gaiellaceae bacterium]|nr:hypothetical protein [Gaiellaceae bacterium]
MASAATPRARTARRVDYLFSIGIAQASADLQAHVRPAADVEPPPPTREG